MIPILLLLYAAPIALRSVSELTDPKYCSRNETCFIVAYDPDEKGAQAEAEQVCRDALNKVRAKKGSTVRCTPVASKLHSDEFHASAVKEPNTTGNGQPGPSEQGGSGPLRGGVRSGPGGSRRSNVPTNVPTSGGVPLGPVLQAALKKGDCRIYDFRITCPGFLPDVEKDRLDRNPRHDGTFEDSPIRLYGGVTAGNEADEHPERFAASTTVCDARDLAAEIFKNYDSKHPIRIVKLRNPDRKDTYLILLSGTEPWNTNQATGVITDARLGAGQPVRYSHELMKAARGLIPKGSRVILAGHSLGGMVAEKAASDPAWQRMFRTTDVITYGSPQVAGTDVVGTRYTRFWEAGDLVPQLSLEAASRKEKYKMIEGPGGPEGGYKDPHLWYPSNPELARYDALGQLGNACLTLDAAETWRFRVNMDGTLR